VSSSGSVDPSADKVLLIAGHDVQAVGQAAREAAPAGATLGLYRLSYSLSRP